MSKSDDIVITPGEVFMDSTLDNFKLLPWQENAINRVYCKVIKSHVKRRDAKLRKRRQRMRSKGSSEESDSNSSNSSFGDACLQDRVDELEGEVEAYRQELQRIKDANTALIRDYDILKTSNRHAVNYIDRLENQLEDIKTKKGDGDSMDSSGTEVPSKDNSNDCDDDKANGSAYFAVRSRDKNSTPYFDTRYSTGMGKCAVLAPSVKKALTLRIKSSNSLGDTVSYREANPLSYYAFLRNGGYNEEDKSPEQRCKASSSSSSLL